MASALMNEGGCVWFIPDDHDDLSRKSHQMISGVPGMFAPGKFNG